MHSFKDSIGYLLGLLIFVIGIPAVMWWVSGRPCPYVPESTLRCVLAVLLAVVGLALSIWSIVYMRKVGKGHPADPAGPQRRETPRQGLRRSLPEL